MLKNIQIVLCTLALVACGSGSDDKKTLDINLDQLKGSDVNPSLTNETASDGGQVNLNTRVTSDISENSSTDFTFTAPSSKWIAVFLTSDAEDLDLSVVGVDDPVSEDSNGLDSNEVVIFKAEEGQTYDIGISSYVGKGTFELTIVEATRASLGLSDNEFLYRLEYDESGTCDNGTSDNWNYNTFPIINFVDGYLENIRSSEQFNFSKVNGNTVTLSGSGQSSGDDYSYEYTYSTTLTVSTSDGSLTGSETYEDSDTYNGNTVNCEYSSDLIGELLL